MSVADLVVSYGEKESGQEVRLSARLLTLLSSQLYRSPLKAVEELVVNSYDAYANVCRIAIDLAPQESGYVAVFDDGHGMSDEGLRELWEVGRSKKRESRPGGRAQIGKFGIGKLAAYSLGNQLTHVSKFDGRVRAVSVDFGEFSRTADETKVNPITFDVLSVEEEGFEADSDLVEVLKNLGVESSELQALESWTIAIIESLQPDAENLKMGRLNWVLRTAMPRAPDFELFLNDEQVRSSKTDIPEKLSFTPGELEAERIERLNKITGVEWSAQGSCLKSSLFPNGICGTVKVYRRSLAGGKSEDILRSHGFFIKVRGRLLNEHDPLFGLPPQSHQTFNSFSADLAVDDLDEKMLSSREEVEDGVQSVALREVLRALFRQARARSERIDTEEFEAQRYKNETERKFVAPRLIDRPLADFFATSRGRDSHGSEADEEWFYIVEPSQEQREDLVSALYAGEAHKFRYEYDDLGETGRLVKFYADQRKFILNEEHEYVRAHKDESGGKQVLEDFVTAEALLEVQLREAEISPLVLGEVLERRDQLLRGLARDHAASLAAIAVELRNASNDERDLEVALVRAARALGFVAKHVSGAGEPDGLGRFVAYPDHDVTITLEAKASAGTPTLAQLDFGGLEEHKLAHSADGCLVVAPSYPGASRGDGASASKRAKESKVSCWTVNLLADVVEAAEKRHITAKEISSIVASKYAPEDVESHVRQLLRIGNGDRQALYQQILLELRALENKMPNDARSLQTLHGRMVDLPGFEKLELKDLRSAAVDLTGASRGALSIKGDDLILATSLDELERRVSQLTGKEAPPRREGPFRS